MPVAWVSRVNFQPPLIGVAINKRHFTNKEIEKAGEFSINIPGIDFIEITDYCGITSGKKIDKSVLFDIFYGDLNNAPMIKSCPLCMECKLVNSMDLPTNTFFVGEIIGVYTEERYLTDGMPDLVKINPFVLTMPDNTYWRIGEKIGKAWSIGKNFKSGGIIKHESSGN